ncbi:MAG TPA: nuclear transport factor 2 family protein [Pyrinomonadaceae bacterium]|nr:nuclear transport factor 2 family protein [Pyrinomonadaceae bacterium]
MKKFFVAALAALALCSAAWVRARAASAEEAAVRQSIEHYFRGHATGSGDEFRKVFHPEAKLFFIRDGKLTQVTSEEYISRATGKPAPDEAKRRRSVESIDVSGNAAVAKLLLDYPDAKITDYMSLLKVDGEWKIINKTFYVERRGAQ